MRTLIIGGGLSGLAIARGLEAQGQEYVLAEGRSRFGGRIITEYHHGAGFDLGPAWFWPGQPRIAELVQQLGLETFEQFAAGDQLYEDDQGRVQRGRGFASMQGSLRLKGGLQSLIQSLARTLNQNNLRLNSAVTGLTKTDPGIVATLTDGDKLTADRVVLAMPPRLAADLKFQPPLPDPAVAAMRSVKTWMAGQAKAVAVYDRAFWRDEHLSGDATSRHGPMVEIHDASPASEGPYALFGFIGVPPKARSDKSLIKQHVMMQLVRLFGPKAEKPAQFYYKDWAGDPLTATRKDLEPVYEHPHYGLPEPLKDLWAGDLHFAGTEVAAVFGGYLEGALEAAEAVLAKLER